MGGGKGGGAEIPKEIEGTAKILRDIGVEQFDLGLPLTQAGGKYGEELLKTGQVGAMMPAVQTAVEASRSSQSQGMQNTMEQATLQGLTGTALQERLAQSRMGAESTVAGVAPSFFAPFLQQVGGPAFNLPGQGLGAIGHAGQIGGVSAGPQGPSAGKSIGSTLGSVVGGVAGTFIAPGIGTALGAQLGGMAGGGIGGAVG